MRGVCNYRYYRVYPGILNNDKKSQHVIVSFNVTAQSRFDVSWSLSTTFPGGYSKSTNSCFLQSIHNVFFLGWTNNRLYSFHVSPCRGGLKICTKLSGSRPGSPEYSRQFLEPVQPSFVPRGKTRHYGAEHDHLFNGTIFWRILRCVATLRSIVWTRYWQVSCPDDV